MDTICFINYLQNVYRNIHRLINIVNFDPVFPKRIIERDSSMFLREGTTSNISARNVTKLVNNL